MIVGHPTQTSYDDAVAALKTLLDHGFQAMFAGGCVRDRIMGRQPMDFDIATSARPEETQRLFESLGCRVIPTGFDHGTVTVVKHSGPVEITTLRRDVKTDGRHAVVDFEGATFETDAARRDFTINAMFEDIHKTVHDYHEGQADLKSRVLRFVGNPTERVREDYLRVLRLFRFMARFGFTPDEAALLAARTEANGLTRISQERVTSELWGTLAGPHAGDALLAMAKEGIISVILPEAETIDHNLKLLILDSTSMPATIRPWLILALMLGIHKHRPWSQDEIHALARKCRMSEKDARTLMDIFKGWKSLSALNREVADALDIADHLERPGDGHDLVGFFGPLWMFLATHARDVTLREHVGWLMAMEEAYSGRRKMTLPVSGQDIMDIHPGVAGRRIGEMMTAARRAFRNGQWHTRQEGLDYLRALS